MTFPLNLKKQLETIVGHQHCLWEKEDLACYAYDATGKIFPPEGVVFPGSTREVASILRLAEATPFYVTPRGSGTGMTGGSLPVKGGIVLCLARLNRILAIDRDNLVAHVEPGVITADFHHEVEAVGLFYPPDPSSAAFSSLGGNLAECAGGPRAVKYGVTRDYVLGLEVVLPGGHTIKTGVQTAKGVVGYDLTRLLVGSEGTLGVITRMILRLLPLPETVRTMIAVFTDMNQAAQTVSQIIRKAIIPRTIEYIDQAAMDCIRPQLMQAFKDEGLPQQNGAILIIELDGSPLEVDAELMVMKKMCRKMAASQIKIAASKEEAATLWQARKAISPALYRYGPDKINEDIVVPRNKIPELVKRIQTLRDKTGLTMVTFGHAGDGNIHVNIMLDKKKTRERQAAMAAVDKIFDDTLDLGGTLSGEHGIGITKSPYLAKELTSFEMHLMQQIKTVFDPKGILNPGKIFKEA